MKTPRPCCVPVFFVFPWWLENTHKNKLEQSFDDFYLVGLTPLWLKGGQSGSTSRHGVTSFWPTGTRCWCRFPAGSACKRAQNWFAFLRPRNTQTRSNFITTAVVTTCVYRCSCGVGEASLASHHDFWFGKPSVGTASVWISTNQIMVWRV